MQLGLGELMREPKTRRAAFGAMGIPALCLLGVAWAGGQTAPQPTAQPARQTAPAAQARPQAGQAAPPQRQLLAEDVYKNIQVLRGVPENQFLSTMGFFAASLNQDCSYCHNSQLTWESYAEDNNEHKQTARRMILMMQNINKTYFGGKREVTCYSCHRGGEKPRVIPNLADMYGNPPADDPNDSIEQTDNSPTADQVLDKYIQAIGGAQKVAGLTSFVAKGNWHGFLETDKRPVEVYAKAPAARTIIIHKFDGDMTTMYDGRTGWVAEPSRPITLLELTGSFLDGAKVEGDLTFPARIKQTLSNWRVGFPITIDDKEVQVVEGKSAAGSPVKLYFDSKSGLLVRLVHYTDSPVGNNPVQWDIDDYRDVSGVKLPYKWTQTWTDGRSEYEMTQIQANVPVDAAKFAKPAPAPALKPGAPKTPAK